MFKVRRSKYRVSEEEKVNIAVPASLHDVIKAYAASRGMTLASATKKLVAIGLKIQYNRESNNEET